MNHSTVRSTLTLGLAVLASSFHAPAPDAALAQQAVILQKATNGQDADVPPGPVVTVGSTVNWTYTVTNATGSRPQRIVVTDDQGVIVSLPGNHASAPGESMICTASGTAVAGQYANLGTVTAQLTRRDASVSALRPQPLLRPGGARGLHPEVHRRVRRRLAAGAEPAGRRYRELDLPGHQHRHRPALRGQT